jgi:tight adherence protein C
MTEHTFAMSPTLEETVALALGVLGAALLGASVGALGARVEPWDGTLAGRVAHRRIQALARHKLLVPLEHSMRWCAGALWGLPRVHQKCAPYLSWQARQLNLAGSPGTLSAEEFPVVVAGLSVLTFCGGSMLGLGTNLVLFLTVIVVAAPFVRVASLAGERRRSAGRSMPRLIDMLALCMSSGMDFIAALRQVSAGDRGVLVDELSYLLRTLEMGQTRREALACLAESLPAPEVGDFCRAVIQAEEKGASVREALVRQAAMARAKRSVRAEELAARAAVLLLGPMLMLVVCIVLLIVGPLLVGDNGF